MLDLTRHEAAELRDNLIEVLGGYDRRWSIGSLFKYNPDIEPPRGLRLRDQDGDELAWVKKTRQSSRYPEGWDWVRWVYDDRDRENFSPEPWARLGATNTVFEVIA